MAADGTIKINTELDSKKAESAMQEFSNGAQKAMKGVTIAIGAAATAMTALAGYSIKVGSDFEVGMSKVSAISGATGEDLDALTEKAKEMGEKTKFSATEAASAFEYMAMAGWKTEDMLNGIEGIMNLAAASGEDLALTSDIVTDALTGFGLTAADSAHFADILAAASSNANTNVSMMGETFKYVAPVAGALGFTAEDTALAIGLMANSGIKAGQAGTALRAALAKMVKPTEDASEMMKTLGINVSNSDGSMKSLNEIMVTLREKMGSLSEATQAQAATTLFGQEAMSGMLAIINASESDYNKLKASIDNCEGSTERMAETMQDNLQGSFTIMQSTLEGFGIQIYEKMQEPLKEAVETGTEYIGRLSDAFEKDGLNGIVEEAGEIFGDLSDKIGETSDTAKKIITPVKNIVKAVKVASDTVLPDASEAFSFFTENLEEIAVVTVTAYTAFETYSLISKGTAASIGLVTKAQAAFNAVMNANPAILTLSAVAALTAGLITYNLTLDESEKSMYKLTEEQEKSIETLKEVTESMKEAREAREENVQAIDLEYDGYEKLLEELQSITDENGKVKEGYEERAKVITGQLSEALGVEIEMQDGVIRGLKETALAIDEVIQKKKAEALLTSLQDDMNKSYEDFTNVAKEYKDALTAQKKAKKDLETVTQDYLAAEKKMQESMGTLNESMALAEYKEMEFLLKDTQAAYDSAAESAYGYEQELNALATQVNDYNALQAAVAEGNADAIKTAMDELLLGYTAYTEEMLAESEQMRQQMYEEAETAVESLKMIQTQGGETYEAFGSDAAVAVAEIIDNFNQLPGGIAQGIKDIGPEASGAMVAALAQADLDGKLDAEGKASLTALLTNYDSLPDDLKEQFEYGVEGALEGLDGFDKVTAKAKEEGISFLDALREVLEVNSPSEAVKEIFGYVWPGALEGLDEGGEDLYEKGKEVCDSFLQTLQESGLKAAMQDFGVNIMALFGAGITSQQGNSESAGKANAESAKKGASSVDPTATGQTFGTKYTQGIGKKTGQAKQKGEELADNAESGADSGDGYTPGSDFGEGFVKGIGDWLKEAANAAAKLALGAYEALRTALDERSPSRKSKKSGKNFDLGLAGGISENENYAISAAEHLGENTLEALDLDEIYKKIGNIDVSEAMDRVNAAVEDKQTRLSDVVVSGVAATSKERYEGFPGNKLSEVFDYERLGNIISNRPVIAVLEMDGDTLATKLVKPISKKMDDEEQLKRLLKGEW